MLQVVFLVYKMTGNWSQGLVIQNTLRALLSLTYVVSNLAGLSLWAHTTSSISKFSRWKYGGSIAECMVAQYIECTLCLEDGSTVKVSQHGVQVISEQCYTAVDISQNMLIPFSYHRRIHSVRISCNRPTFCHQLAHMMSKTEPTTQGQWANVFTEIAVISL